ncbi:GNAT family N-acetyltransferase [Roseovarius pacificus]|uniref:GNAT family N-acetyltransferase n=1 Tax=Roseovarius pacificus TaxID=337701 RepID=UPI002A18929B|nr:GNAT family N-acetyltransferase [Roseovarius pacificus]
MTPVIGLTDDLATCRALRETVFIQEQGVSEAEEYDGLDDRADHILARLNGQPVGCARILYQGDTGKIGRVCVLRQARGTGLGAALIRACLDHLGGKPGIARAMLGAQTHAIGFYEKLGFTAFGPEYLDAGIPHRDMDRPL